MVSKVVIPVAGQGTRMLPASKSVPKEMLPVVDRPGLAWVVDEAVRAGLTEIILVTSAGKSAVEDYFDRAPSLEQALEAKGKTGLLDEVRHPVPDNVNIVSVRQGEPLGLGHAVYCARRVVGDEPFAVMLADVLVDGVGGREDLAAMIERYRGTGSAQVMVETVPDNQVHQYGIARISDASPEVGASVAMEGIVEKPTLTEAPSNFSVVGRYVLPAAVMDLLADTPPGAGDEIQLTDAIARLMETETVEAYAMRGMTFDCGSKMGYLEAILHFARQHPELGDAARGLIERYASGD
jgi:UTP--glucose-1-phosphate uridylyltransferase